MDTVTVNAKALREVLSALNGPVHHIRELQVTRRLAQLPGMEPNPIDVLLNEYNAAVAAEMTKEQAQAAESEPSLDTKETSIESPDTTEPTSE